MVGGGVVIVGIVKDGGGMVGGGDVGGGLVGGDMVGGGPVGGTEKSGKVGKVKGGKSGGVVWAPADDSVSPAVPAHTATTNAMRRFQTCTPTSRSAPTRVDRNVASGGGPSGPWQVKSLPVD